MTDAELEKVIEVAKSARFAISAYKRIRSLRELSAPKAIIDSEVGLLDVRLKDLEEKLVFLPSSIR